MSRLRLVALSLSALMLFPVEARADIHEDCKRLALSTDHATAEPQIATCTKSIAAAQRANDRGLLSKAYIRRGLAYLDKRDLDLALSDFNAALKIAPRSLEALENRADVYREKKQFDLALRDYNEVLRLDDKQLSALLGRGRLYLLMSDKARARTDFEAVIARPSDGSALDEWAKREAQRRLDALGR